MEKRKWKPVSRNKVKNIIPYDRENKIPVIRSSICTGEQVAGFKDKKTGRFEEVMLIRNESDMELFISQYDINPSEVKKEY